MNYIEYLTQIIDSGIKAAKTDYTDPKDNLKLSGSIEGFEICRDKLPAQLLKLLNEAQIKSWDAITKDADDYWFWRCRELEIEWVCNCVSAMLINQGIEPIITPTARGVMRAAEIIGCTVA